MKRARRSSPRAVRGWLRWVAAFALVLLGADHVVPSLHYAFVAHELCPEHGVIEHVGSRTISGFHRENFAAYQASTTGGEHHDHCGSLPASPPRAPIAAPAATSFSPVLGEPERATLLSAPVRSADVVAFAPKQSPPA